VLFLAVINTTSLLCKLEYKANTELPYIRTIVVVVVVVTGEG
jgi:hypothetical protein